jgi:Ferritin-like domain
MTTQHRLTIADVDQDGALSDALHTMYGSRADFLRKATLGGAALLGALALPETSAAATKNDVGILNYALVLEYLQASFYTETERIGGVGSKALEATRVVGAVERAHVKALRKALGSAAVARPTFNFRGTTEDTTKFLKTAVAFEDLAVAAYKAQAPLIDSKAILAVAISIHSVEARHAAWMRRLFEIVPAVSAFDEPLSKPKVSNIVASTHFIVSSGATTRRGKPRFTG